MLNCEYCNNEHDGSYGSGRFCSEKCARGFSTKEKRSLINKKISKILTKEPYKKICLNCKKEFETKKKKQKFCLIKCYHIYRLKEVKKHINNYQVYKRNCQFNFNLNDYPNEFDFSLIKKYGWYKAKNHGNNLNGVSRDHMFSIKEGFLQKINSKLISHPANCQLLKHNNNSSKYKKSSITLKELKDKIEKWNKKYGGMV